MLDTHVQHNISLLPPIPNLNPVGCVIICIYIWRGRIDICLKSILQPFGTVFERSELEFQSIIKSFNLLVATHITTQYKDIDMLGNIIGEKGIEEYKIYFCILMGNRQEH